MAIGASWASGSWAETPDAWAAGTWADGADVPANQDPETAIVIGALPFTFSQNVHSADTGITYSVYYQYTPTVDEVISVWGFGSSDLTTYRPALTVSINNGLDIYQGILAYPQKPTYFEVDAGVTYWFRFVSNAGDPSPAILHLTVQSFTQGVAPAGSILINDAASGFPMALLSASTGEPQQYVLNFPAGEVMSQVGSFVLAQDIEAENIKLFNGQYQLVANVNEFAGVVMGSDRASLFYLGHDSTSDDPGLVQTVNTAGVIGETVWTLASGVGSLAPSRDNTILYYQDGTSGAAIRRWDLVNNVGLSNLAAGVVGSIVRNLFVLADDTILVMYRETSGTVTQVIRYANTGATLTTYTTQFLDNVANDPHLAMAGDDPASWWAWFKIAGGLSRFINVQTSDGTILTSLESYHFTSGLYDGPTSATPNAFFGHSESCTFLITALPPIPPPTPSTPGRTLYIRRLRQAPHLSHEQLMNFYMFFQLDLEAGVGVSGSGRNPQNRGEDPQVMIAWSDDGGHTWSKEHWVSAGRQGAYKARAVLRRMGRSRDRVYRVVVSDPVRWNLVAAYLDVIQGTS